MIEKPESENPFKKASKDKVADPKHSTRKVKAAFLDLEPNAYKPLKEQMDERIDMLIRLGIGDPGKISFYRTAMQDPAMAVGSATYRPYAGHALASLLQVILSDTSLFNRVLTVLRTHRGNMQMEDVIQAALQMRQNADEDVNPTRQKTVHKKHPRNPKELLGPK